MSNAFQKSARSKLANVLAKHGIDQGFQESEDADGRPWMLCVFEWKGEEHQIEIFEETVVMTKGRQLFEPYMPEEFTSDEAQICGFCTRLGRYLSGGTWEGPDERGWAGRILRRLRRLV